MTPITSGDVAGPGRNAALAQTNPTSTRENAAIHKKTEQGRGSKR
jgi:hypothetical protein